MHFHSYLKSTLEYMGDLVRTSELRHELERVRRATVDIFDTLTDGTVHQPLPGFGWTPLMVWRHLELTDEAVLQVLKRLESRIGTDTAVAPDRVQVGFVRESLVRDALTIDSLPNVVPGDSTDEPYLLIPLQTETRVAILDIADRAAVLDRTGITARHPALGPLDIYGWLVFLVDHEWSHHSQLMQPA